jgi:hypothetical protein
MTNLRPKNKRSKGEFENGVRRISAKKTACPRTYLFLWSRICAGGRHQHRQHRVFRQIDNVRVCRNLHRIGRARGNNFFFFNENEDDLVTEKLARLAVK